MSSITKGSLVNGAYALMRISGLTVQATPSDIEIGLSVADDYAAQLKGDGLDVGWNYPSNYGESDPADISGVRGEVAGALKKLLVIELCSTFGKEIPMASALTAREGMRVLENFLVTIPNTENPSTLPFGSGNEWSYRDQKFYAEPANNHDADYVFKGDILNYSHDFTQWLNGETLVGVVWATEDTGITISGEVFDDSEAVAELTFNQRGGYPITITATKTNSTDKITVTKNFIIDEAIQTGLV